jgi:hypothetical protein
MDNWLLFWKLLLMAAFAMFGILAVVVAIGGFSDIRALFRSVDAQHESEHQSASSRDGRDTPH